MKLESTDAGTVPVPLGVHATAVALSLLALAWSSMGPPVFRPADIFLALVVLQALKGPGIGGLLSAALYGLWMDMLHSWHAGHALAFVGAYLLIQGFNRFFRVTSAPFRTLVGCSVFLLTYLLRWGTYEAFGPADYFRWTAPLFSLVSGAFWIQVLALAAEKFEAWGSRRRFALR